MHCTPVASCPFAPRRCAVCLSHVALRAACCMPVCRLYVVCCMLHFVTRSALARASERGLRQHGCVGAVAAYAGEGIGFGLVSCGHAMPARSAKITESGSFGAVPTTCGRQALQHATHTYRITGALSTDRHPMWPCAPAGRSPPLATQAGGGLSPPTNYYRWVATQTAAAPGRYS